MAASFFLSGLLMYFCFWNIFSRAFLCTSEKTARRSIPLLGFPLAARGHENVPGIGTTEEDAIKEIKKLLEKKIFLKFSAFYLEKGSLFGGNEAREMLSGLLFKSRC